MDGVPPTGKTVEWDAWQVLRVEDGLIVEERMLMDEWSLHQQLTSSDRSGDPPREHKCGGFKGSLHH
jgi:hypothetical protein